MVPEMPSPDRGDDGERRGRSYGQTSSVQERSTDYSYWRERERERETGVRGRRGSLETGGPLRCRLPPIISQSALSQSQSLSLSALSLHRTAVGAAWSFPTARLHVARQKGGRPAGQLAARRWMGLDWSGYPLFH